jgi:hypothetical protein
MYDEVYDAMVLAGVAIKLDAPIWVNQQGFETDEADAFGRKVTHMLMHPEYMLFVDEVGCNTSQEGDGAHGGERKIVGRGTVPKESATTNDNHFTILGFTSASGEPVMCGVIIEGSKIRSYIVTGMDIFATKIGDELDEDFIEKTRALVNNSLVGRNVLTVESKCHVWWHAVKAVEFRLRFWFNF